MTQIMHNMVLAFAFLVLGGMLLSIAPLTKNRFVYVVNRIATAVNVLGFIAEVALIYHNWT